MKQCLLFFFLLSFSMTLVGCSNMGYLYHQGIGQLSIDWNGRKNEEVLLDPKIKDEYKNKIRAIQEYKKFYFEQLDLPPTQIYNKTTMLKTEAVSHLVIVSPHDKVSANTVSFPFYGEFPYLAFFDEERANAYQKEWSEKGFFTYKRPVYAYSTLNDWITYDKILSSFFRYDEYELSKLIFHELTHTVFFIKNEIGFNENMAELIADLMAQEFWSKKKGELYRKHTQEQKEEAEFRELMTKLAHDYAAQLEAKKPKNKAEATNILSKMFKTSYSQSIHDLCQRQKITHCPNESKYWNNARLAAYMTYNDRGDVLRNWALEKKFTPKSLLDYLQKKYDAYRKDSNGQKSFWNYLEIKA